MRKVQVAPVYATVSKAIADGYTVVSAQGSSRSAKTYNILIYLIYYLLSHPGLRLSIVRKTLPALKGSVFVDFKEIMQQRMGIWDEKAMNKSEMTYTFSNGSWVDFFSVDNEQKMRGRKRDILFCNEANELTFVEWTQLKMRTTRFAILDYNPSYSDEHWLCGLNRDPRTFHFISTYKQNPFLEQVIIDEIEGLQKTSPSLWRIYGLGLQAVVEGLVFPEYDVVDEIPAGVRDRAIGLDFGFRHDPTAIVEVAVSGKDMWLDEKCYRTEMLTGEIIQELKACTVLPDGRRMKVIADCAEPREIEEIYRAGINVKPVKKYAGSIVAGINKMLEYRLHVTATSLNWIKEFKNYVWMQDKEGKWLNQPCDQANHLHDAARYVVMEEIMGGQPQGVDLQRIYRSIY